MGLINMALRIERRTDLSTGQNIKPQLKPLIFGSAGGARTTKNQRAAGWCPVLREQIHILKARRYQALRIDPDYD